MWVWLFESERVPVLISLKGVESRQKYLRSPRNASQGCTELREITIRVVMFKSAPGVKAVQQIDGYSAEKYLARK